MPPHSAECKVNASPATLDEVLAVIDPAVTLDAVASQVIAARNTFSTADVVVTEWASFEDLLARYHRHVESTVAGLKEPIDIDLGFYWNRCVPLLKRAFGPNGPRLAFELSITGAEGGLARVLDVLGAHLARQYAENGIRGHVNAFLNGLSIDGKIEAADEYSKRFGRLLASGLIESPMHKIRAEFRRVLEGHPELVQRLARVLRD